MDGDVGGEAVAQLVLQGAEVGVRRGRGGTPWLDVPGQALAVWACGQARRDVASTAPPRRDGRAGHLRLHPSVADLANPVRQRHRADPGGGALERFLFAL